VRWLMWFTVGFAVACGLGVYALFGPWLLLFGISCVIGFVGMLFVRTPMGKRIATILLGIVIGLLWLFSYQYFYLQSVRKMDGQSVRLDIAVTDYSRSAKYGITAEGKTEINGKAYTVQFYINDSVSLAPGDRVEGGFTLRYTNGGNEDPTYHRGKGIVLLCYPKGSYRIIPQAETSIQSFPTIWRYKILTLLNQLFPGDTAPFAKALLLGDTRGLDFSTQWSMKTSGVYHVVAVSGMHVSILFALISLLCLKRRVLLALIGIPVLFLFAAIAGFTPSIVRACIMQVLVILALLTDKEYDPPTALAAAVLILLICNPLAITSVSLQLSAGCMIGIFLFTQRIHNYLLSTRLGPAKGKSIRARLTRWAVGSVSVTLGAMSVTAPLCGIYYGCISISGIFANLLILWLISFLFYGIMAACLLGAIWLPLGVGVGWLLSWPIRLIIWVIDMISRLPASAVYTSSVYIVAWLLFVGVLLFVFLKSKKKYPAVFAICIVVSLLGSIFCSWLEPRLDDYRITAVDVGQGQCILLQQDGKHYMVDCGGETGDYAADEAIKLLLSQGVFRLDGLIITHYDADHAGGAMQLLDKIPADTLYLPQYSGENSIRDALAQSYGNKIRWITEDTVLQDVSITLYPSEDVSEANESSLCILFQPNGCDILITGDRSVAGETELMAHTDLPDLEILIAGHHGSRTSTSWELLNETRPEIVIISVGANNSYGHPTEETLTRLDLFGCKIYRTDQLGTVIFRG